MKSIDFLKNELQIIANKFPNVHIKYGYNNVIQTHVVELLPLVEYRNNNELDKNWIPLSLKFMEIYKLEEITFISSDSSLSISDIIFEFNANACSEENVIAEIFAPLTEELLISYSFPTEIPDGIIMENDIVSILKMPIDQLNTDFHSEYSYSAAA